MARPWSGAVPRCAGSGLTISYNGSQVEPEPFRMIVDHVLDQFAAVMGP